VAHEIEAAPDPGDLDLVTVLATGDPALIALAHSLLESAGVSFVTTGEGVQDLVGLGRFGSGFNVAIGPVQFQVRAEDADEARELLADLEEYAGEEEDPFSEEGEAPDEDPRN